MYENIRPYDGLFNVCYYKCPRIVTFKADVDDAFASTVGINSSIVSCN